MVTPRRHIRLDLIRGLLDTIIDYPADGTDDRDTMSNALYCQKQIATAARTILLHELDDQERRTV